MQRLLMLCAAAVMTGCSLNTTMVPVAGPMSLQRPIPTIKVHATGMFEGTHGEVSFAMPDSEQCKGKWAATSGGPDVSVSSASLMSQYGSTYLSGYTISGSSGTHGQALAVCDRRTVQMEFVAGGSAHGAGIAKDSEGNVYRFVF